MNDIVLVALIGLCGAIVAAIPATVSALGNRRSIRQAVASAHSANSSVEKVASVLGVTNGSGDISTMLTRVLEWCITHSSADEAQLKIINQQLQLAEVRLASLEVLLDHRTPLFKEISDQQIALTQYTHERMHDIMNSLTILRGKQDLLWNEYVTNLEPKHDTEEIDNNEKTAIL